MKKYLAVLLAAAMVFALAGCGSKEMCIRDRACTDREAGGQKAR